MRLEGVVVGVMLGACAVLAWNRLAPKPEVRTGACCEEYLQHIADHHHETVDND